ncbi:MAG TPA: efflux RND transporter periplasmic adaptor subunit [Acidimicrobiia bacterium]
MTTRNRTLVLSAALTASVLGAGTFAYGALAGADPSSASSSTTRVVTASLGTVQATVSATGTLAPATSLDLNFADGGTLTAVAVKAGDTVTAGQVLARIDDAAAKVGLETARADLLAAQAKLTAAKAATTVDAVAVAQATAALHQAQLTVTGAQKTLDATTLKAPVAGTITALNGAVGGTVSAGGSTAFATLVDTSTMVADVSWAEADAGQVAVGQTATITIDSLSQSVAGTVTSVATTSTVVSDVVTYAGVVTLDQVPDGVKSGMTATVSVVTASKSNVIAVPSAALTTRPGASTVTVSANGQTASRTVTLGLKGDGTTQIVSGLSAGEQVVMSVGTVSGTASSSSSSRSSGTGLAGVTGGDGFTGPPPGAP